MHGDAGTMSRLADPLLIDVLALRGSAENAAIFRSRHLSPCELNRVVRSDESHRQRG